MVFEMVAYLLLPCLLFLTALLIIPSTQNLIPDNSKSIIILTLQGLKQFSNNFLTWSTLNYLYLHP
jgi:hypothetical protein